MRLFDFLEELKASAQAITGEENPEIIFAGTINKNEIVGGIYDGMFETDDGRAVIDVDFDHADQVLGEDEEDEE